MYRSVDFPRTLPLRYKLANEVSGRGENGLVALPAAKDAASAERKASG
jgi:hypothetical protein